MLTAMTEEDWKIVLRVFAASRSRRGAATRAGRELEMAQKSDVILDVRYIAITASACSRRPR